ncbi:hypothetical protein SODG_005990 [Sodalis praecaptivus]
MLEKQNQLLLDLIELQKQVINDLDLIRDTCSSQINPQNLAKKQLPPDFVATYAKKKVYTLTLLVSPMFYCRKEIRW